MNKTPPRCEEKARPQGASRSPGWPPGQGLQRRGRAFSSQPVGLALQRAQAGVASRLCCAAPRRDSLLRLRPLQRQRGGVLFTDKLQGDKT
jgi:hypothetical protein